MLGSDPLAAILGAATDPRSPATVWKSYLRKLVSAGAAVTMLGPDVVVPDDANEEVVAALALLLQTYPTASQMPEESSGVLAEVGVVDTDGDRVNRRVATYWRHIIRVLGRDLAAELISSGAVTAAAGIHVGASSLVSVTAPDADALLQWRSWTAEVAGDSRERHSAPTVLLPTCPGGGVYLFRTDESVPPDLAVPIAGCTIHTGDYVVPIPPTRLGGKPVSRLGPARMLPGWLRQVLENAVVPQRGNLPVLAAAP